MIGIFRHQQMRQHGGRGTAARGRQCRCRCLGDRVAAPAGVFRPDMAEHPEPAGDIVEDLGDVFTEPGYAPPQAGQVQAPSCSGSCTNS
jgi:hypothetical protein